MATCLSSGHCGETAFFQLGSGSQTWRGGSELGRGGEGGRTCPEELCDHDAEDDDEDDADAVEDLRAGASAI